MATCNCPTQDRTETCKCGALLELHLVTLIEPFRHEPIGATADVLAVSHIDAKAFASGESRSATHDIGVIGNDLSVSWLLGTCAATMQVCRSCGCTELRPCEDGGYKLGEWGVEDGSCHWVAPDLCSACLVEEAVK